jgi:hypothetical protein
MISDSAQPPDAPATQDETHSPESPAPKQPARNNAWVRFAEEGSFGSITGSGFRIWGGDE